MVQDHPFQRKQKLHVPVLKLNTMLSKHLPTLRQRHYEQRHIRPNVTSCCFLAALPFIGFKHVSPIPTFKTNIYIWSSTIKNVINKQYSWFWLLFSPTYALGDGPQSLQELPEGHFLCLHPQYHPPKGQRKTSCPTKIHSLRKKRQLACFLPNRSWMMVRRTGEEGCAMTSRGCSKVKSLPGCCLIQLTNSWRKVRFKTKGACPAWQRSDIC